MAAQLFEIPGPKAKRRNAFYEGLALLVLAALAYLAIRALVSNGVFDAAAWAPFKLLGVWKQLGIGFFNNARAAVVAMLFSMGLGCWLAWGLVARRRAIRRACRVYTDIWNGIPVLLSLFFVSLALPALGLDVPDFWFLVISLSLYSSAAIGDIVSSGIESLPRGQSEAAVALGFSEWQKMWWILLPQAIKVASPALVSQLVIVLKGTTLAFVLGGYFDLLRAATVLGAYFSRSLLQAQVIAALAFMIVNIALEYAATRIETKIK